MVAGVDDSMKLEVFTGLQLFDCGYFFSQHNIDIYIDILVVSPQSSERQENMKISGKYGRCHEWLGRNGLTSVLHSG